MSEGSTRTVKENVLTGLVLGAPPAICAFLLSFVQEGGPMFENQATWSALFFSVLTGVWLGHQFGTAKRRVLGAGFGALLGVIYACLVRVDVSQPGVPSEQLINLFILYPTVMSGLMAAVVANRESSFARVPQRLLKGMLAGLVFGSLHFIFCVALVLASAAMYHCRPSGDFPIFETTLALSLASAVYLPMQYWAADLTPRTDRPSVWQGRFTMWRVGLALFAAMSALGALWPVFMTPVFTR